MSKASESKVIKAPSTLSSPSFCASTSTYRRQCPFTSSCLRKTTMPNRRASKQRRPSIKNMAASRESSEVQPEAENRAPVSGAYMAFSVSMSLLMAYRQEVLDSTGKSYRPRPPPRRPRTAPTRASKPAKTIAPSASSVQQLPAFPTAAACDGTQARLSAEAQLIQARARESHNARLSAISDRESLHCLESFPNHIHNFKRTGAAHRDCASLAILERATSHLKSSPPLSPNYISPAEKYLPPCKAFEDAPQTTQPTNSSGKPLKSIEEHDDSFSDDSELFRDDSFFQTHLEVGDRLPVGGISLFAHLEDIRVREAGGDVSSASSSLPRVLSVQSADQGVERDESSEMQRVKSKREEIEEWLHVEDSMDLRRQAGEEQQKQAMGGKATVALVAIGKETDVSECEWDAVEEASCESELKNVASGEETDQLVGLGDALQAHLKEQSIAKTTTQDEGAEKHSAMSRELAKEFIVEQQLSQKGKFTVEDVGAEGDDWLQVEDAEFLHREMTGDEF